jgi:hypothetical protein
MIYEYDFKTILLFLTLDYLILILQYDFFSISLQYWNDEFK